MVGFELQLLVGPNGFGKRRIGLRSKSMRLLCIHAESLIRQHYAEGVVSWICTPPVIEGMTVPQRIRAAERIKNYLQSVTMEIASEKAVAMVVTSPEGPLRSAA